MTEKNFNYAKLGNSIEAIDFDELITINSKYTQQEIEDALTSKNSKKLIEMSNYFYLTSGEYRRLLHSESTIQTFQYIYAPIYKQSKKVSKMDKAYEEVTEYLMNSNIEETNTYITFSVLLNGMFCGVERKTDNLVILQELPVQYCRSTFDINGLHAIEFDFRYFDRIKNAKEKMLMFERLPEEFLSSYNDYKAGVESETSKDKYWRLIDPETSRCHYLTNDKLPLFSSSFSEIVNLQEYKEIDKTRSKLDIYKILVQKIPLDKTNNEPILDEEQAKDIHNNAKRMLGSDQLVDVLTTPAEVDSVDISNKTDKTKEIVDVARTNMFSSMGTSQLLFNSGTTSIGLTESIKNDESLIVPLIREYEKYYNYKLQSIGKSSVNFFLKDLGVTIYNAKEKNQIFKEQATLGGVKLPYFVSCGVKQYEIMNMLKYEDEIGLLYMLKPLQTSYTISGNNNDSENGSGRPQTETPSEETTKQKDKNTPKNRAKK